MEGSRFLPRPQVLTDADAANILGDRSPFVADSYLTPPKAKKSGRRINGPNAARLSDAHRLLRLRYSLGVCRDDRAEAYFRAVLPHLAVRDRHVGGITALGWAREHVPGLVEERGEAWIVAEERALMNADDKVFLTTDQWAQAWGILDHEVERLKAQGKRLRCSRSVRRTKVIVRAERTKAERERREKNGAQPRATCKAALARLMGITVQYADRLRKLDDGTYERRLLKAIDKAGLSAGSEYVSVISACRAKLAEGSELVAVIANTDRDEITDEPRTDAAVPATYAGGRVRVYFPETPRSILDHERLPY